MGTIDKTSVAVYEAKVCYKKNDNVILMWNDEAFDNMVTFTGVEVKEVLHMAESLYNTEEKK